MSADCIIRQFDGCACLPDECADQVRHQRTADLFARQRAEEERFKRGTRIIARGTCFIAAIAFIGIFYAAGSHADQVAKNQLLDSQESGVHVARR